MVSSTLLLTAILAAPNASAPPAIETVFASLEKVRGLPRRVDLARRTARRVVAEAARGRPASRASERSAWRTSRPAHPGRCRRPRTASRAARSSPSSRPTAARSRSSPTPRPAGSSRSGSRRPPAAPPRRLTTRQGTARGAPVVAGRPVHRLPLRRGLDAGDRGARRPRPRRRARRGEAGDPAHRRRRDRDGKGPVGLSPGTLRLRLRLVPRREDLRGRGGRRLGHQQLLDRRALPRRRRHRKGATRSGSRPSRSRVRASRRTAGRSP